MRTFWASFKMAPMGDVGRREHGGSHLVEQRLKQVVVDPVDESYRHGLSGQGFGGIQPAETSPDNDNPRQDSLGSSGSVHKGLSRGELPSLVHLGDVRPASNVSACE